MPDINMPKLSDTMEEGTIVEWKKKSGDQVKTGEVLAEVESDKATFDLEAESDGVLQILVDQGVPAKIGAPIARIGEGVLPIHGEVAPKAPEGRPQTQKAPASAPKGKEPENAKKAYSAAEAVPPAPTADSPPPPPEGGGGRGGEASDGQQDGREVRASPLARRLAEEMGVDLASLRGSG